MINLILNHPDDELNLTKTIVNIDDWRVIGIMNDRTFYLITSNCHVYHINNLTLEKFHDLMYIGFDLSVTGVFNTVDLICPHCTGKGITDWVSNITGAKKISSNFKFVFTRDYNASPLQVDLYSNHKKFPAYFSRAQIPKAHQYCKDCDGTGLFSYTLARDGNFPACVQNGE